MTSTAGRALIALAPVVVVMAVLGVLDASAVVLYAVALTAIAVIAVYAVVLPAGVRRPPRPLPLRPASRASSRPSPRSR